MHFRDARGTWQDIDGRLRRADGRLLNRANSFSTSLPLDLANDSVRLRKRGAWVAFRLRGARAKAEPRGDSVRYRGAWPDVDVGYRAQRDSLKETLTLQRSATKRAFAFDVQIPRGMRPKLLESGALVIRDRRQRTRLSMAAPFMIDRRGRTRRVGVRLVKVSGRWRMTLRLSDKWLNRAGRAWPVVVDPNIFPSADRDCYVSSGQPETSLCANSGLRVGTSGGSEHRALMHFDVSGVPRGAEVHGASLEFNLTSDTVGSNTTWLNATPLEETWTTAASWNRNDGTDRWSEPGGETGSSTSTENTFAYLGVSPGTVSIQSAQVVRDWIARKRANHGFVIKAEQPINAGTIADNASATPPKLRVYYDSRYGERRGWVHERQQITDRISLGVNVATGNLQVTQKDFSMPGGLGPAVAVSRTYNSLNRDTDDALGEWQLDTGQDTYLEQLGGAFVVLHAPGGVEVSYVRKHDGSYITPAGRNDKLVRNGDGTFTLTDNASQTKMHFASPTTGFGILTKIEDRNGRKLDFEYPSGSYELTRIKDSNDDTSTNADDVRFTYGGTPRRLTGMTDPAGRAYTYTYTSDKLTSYTDPHNGASFKTLYEYNNACSKLSKITTPQGNVTTIAYYAIGHEHECKVQAVTRVTDTATMTGPTTTFEYDLRRDGSGETEVTDPIGTSTTDQNDRITRHVFDEQARVTKTIDALGRENSRKLTSNSNVESYTAAGNAGTTPNTKFTYDDATDNLTATATPTTVEGGDPMTTSASYGGSNVNSGTPGIEYLPTRAVNEQGGVTKIEYNGAGDTNGNPYGIKRYSSDGTTLVSGVAMQYLPKTTTDPVNNPASLDAKGGQLKSITDGRGKLTVYGYDTKGNVNSIDPPGTGANQLGTTRILYDGNLARIDTVRDGKGNCRVMGYDALDRVTSVEFRGACPETFTNSPTDLTRNVGTLDSHEPRVQYSYDRDGNQLTEATREEVAPGGTGTSRTRTMIYDKLNRVTSETFSFGGSNTYTYDLVGNLRSLTDAGGKVEYTYDAANQQRAVYEPGTAKPTKFRNNKDGLREHTAYPNGVTIDWGYDHASRLRSIVAKGPGGSTTLQSLAYKYRQPSSPNRQTPLRYEAEDTVLDRRTRYDYDGLDRLTSAVTKIATATASDWNATGANPIVSYTYGLDGAGNITSREISGSGVTADLRTFAYDEANQLCWRSPTSGPPGAPGLPPSDACTTSRQTAFDANGNELTGASSTNRTAAYHLTDQTKTLSISASPTSLVYLGAGQDRWITEGTGSFQHNVLGAGKRTVGTSTDYFTRDEGGTLVSRRNGTTRHYYLFDALGSVTGLVNGDSTGAVVARYDYEPYGGRDVSATGATASADVPQGQFGFGGGYRTVGGIYHFGQRFYDPTIMRWTQADPLDQSGSLREGNRYAYAASDPVGVVDPAGTHGCNPRDPACQLDHGIRQILGRREAVVEVTCYYMGLGPVLDQVPGPDLVKKFAKLFGKTHPASIPCAVYSGYNVVKKVTTVKHV